MDSGIRMGSVTSVYPVQTGRYPIGKPTPVSTPELGRDSDGWLCFSWLSDEAVEQAFSPDSTERFASRPAGFEPATVGLEIRLPISASLSLILANSSAFGTIMLVWT